MIKGLLSFYVPSFPRVIVYMLQSTEYQPKSYLKWFWRTNNFNHVMRRRTLDKTRAAEALLFAMYVGCALQIICSVILLYRWQFADSGMWQVALAVYLAYPIIWAHLIVVPLVMGRLLISKPKENRLIAESQTIFRNHPGKIIAVAGSYGKTSMKELLGTVLSEGKKVAITPANKNVAISHAYFAKKLTGDEDILVLEYGEGRPGDVARFAETTQPDIGIITGIAPAHLDQYPSLDAAARDIFSLADYLHDKNTYVNGESQTAVKYAKSTHHLYTHKGIEGWKVGKYVQTITETQFVLSKGTKKIHVKSGLLGAHQVGPLALVAVLALDLGLTVKQVEAGLSKTTAFEHRLQPRPLAGAWILDDTYNGNIDGIRAGLSLLASLPAKRKIYVTPGLVDQGIENKRVHTEMGSLIAQAKPDLVVLMQNSATNIIKSSLEESGYAGEIQVQDDPLYFYTHLEHSIAAGDIVLMQNDWTDNYA